LVIKQENKVRCVVTVAAVIHAAVADKIDIYTAHRKYL